MTAPLAWMDVVSTEFEASMRFYDAVFDWTREAAPQDLGEYYFVRVDGEIVAGAEPIDPSKGAPRWTVFVQTDDVEAIARLATEQGGRVAFAPQSMGTFGRIAMIEDPAGSTVGVWQAVDFDPSATGQVPSRLVGAELATPLLEAVLPFYLTVFGWTVLEDRGGEVHLDTGGPAAVLRSGTGHTQWVPVLGVPDLETTADRIRAAGGVATPAATPGLIAVTDPLDAPFLLAHRGA